MADSETYETGLVPDAVPDRAVIHSIDELVARIIFWHTQGMKQAEHMLLIPEGFEAEYPNPDGTSTKIELKGDVLQAFRFGIMTGIDAFMKLPIAYVEETKEAANEPDPNAEHAPTASSQL